MEEKIILKAKHNCKKCNGKGYFINNTGKDLREKAVLYCSCMIKQMNKYLLEDSTKQFKSEIKEDEDGIKRIYSTLEKIV